MKKTASAPSSARKSKPKTDAKEESTPKLLALLVGVNTYQGRVNPLNGCVNDINRIHQYLQARTQPSANDKNDNSAQAKKLNYVPMILTAGDADNPQEIKPTRQAVIDGFRKHLTQAGENDVALFYFSGHGSQEPTPPEFRHLEPDGLNETLVCHDSRSEGGWDLADKELAVLISEVAKNNPHIVLIIDACHSGSITRDANLDGIRLAPRDERKRALVDYEGWQTIAAAKAAPQKEDDGGNWLTLPVGRHVVFSACRSEELAAERKIWDEGEVRGMLSYTLLDALKGNSSGGLTYRDIAAAIKSRVNNEVAAQHPQVEGDAPAMDTPFLGGAILPQPSYFDVTYDDSASQRGWVIHGGAVHGLQPPTDNSKTTLAVFSAGVDLTAQSNKPIGTATVQTVGAGISTITLTLNDEPPPDKKRTFRARITSQPTPRFTVWLEGEAEQRPALQAALKGSSMVREVGSQSEADFVVQLTGKRWTIKRFQDNSPLMVPVESDKLDDRATIAVQRLQHMAHWLRVARLGNKNSTISANAIKIEPFESDIKGTLGKEMSLTSDIRLKQTKANGKWVPAYFRLKLTNTSSTKLHCTLLDLGDDFSVSLAGFFATDSQALNPDESIWVYQHKKPSIPVSMSPEVQKLEVPAYRDTIKLIVSTDEFEATSLTQDPLTVSTMRGLADTAVTIPESDWMTQQFVLTTECPRDSVVIPAAGQTSNVLMDSVVVQGHAALAGATVEVTVQEKGARDAGDLLFPPTFRNAEGWRPLGLDGTRGDTVAHALSLRNVQNREQVTAEAPLKLTVRQTLQPNQIALATAYDPETELYLPLGLGTRAANGQDVEFAITHLPAPTADGTRSLGGSIKMALQVIASEKLGWGTNPNRLRLVKFDAAGKPTYEDDVVTIKQAVAQASKVWLYVHGFTGDTDGMVMSAPNMPQWDAATAVLAFDYENIVSTIEVTAEDLNERLRKVNLMPESGKDLTIVAHSLGTVVTRWLVERTAGGSQIVKHAILVGGPQLGTPWAGIAQKLFSLLAGLVVNGVTAVASPPAWVANLLATVGGGAFGQKVLVTLGELNPKSKFYDALNGRPVNTGARYTVIAGDATKMNYSAEQASVLKKLLAKFGPEASGFVLGSPNDLVIAVSSIQGIPADRTAPTTNSPAIPSDHISYFATQAGLAALAKAL
jgi:pimeloyl-ACP methyl ester carboxylesterase